MNLSLRIPVRVYRTAMSGSGLADPSQLTYPRVGGWSGRRSYSLGGHWRRMSGTWLGAAVAGALIGAVVTPLATDRGLAQLARVDASSNGLRLVSALGGAAACCDAVSQRVPTPLVRQAGVGTAVLMALGLALHGDWRGLLISAIAATASGLTLLLCWRFAG